MEEETQNLEEEKTDEQQTIREKRIEQLRPYQWKKGQSGNALGRYLGGKSGKERVKAMIASMTDEEFEEFMEGMNKKDIWEMAEGKPQTDITSGGEAIKPQPIINVISTNISDNENTETTKEIENNTGGNIGKQDNLNPPILDSDGTVRQATDTDEHSVGELPAPKEGSGEGLPANNEGTSVL